MKYVIDLKKNGTLRGTVIRKTEAEAKEIAEEWFRRGCGNTAEYRAEEKLWIAIYFCGDLTCVVDDDEWECMKEEGLFEGDTRDWLLVRDGRFYETLSEGTFAMLKEFYER